VDLDRDFVQGLRELKFLSEKEVVDEHKLYVSAVKSSQNSKHRPFICHHIDMFYSLL